MPWFELDKLVDSLIAYFFPMVGFMLDWEQIEFEVHMIDFMDELLDSCILEFDVMVDSHDKRKEEIDSHFDKLD